ncbi:MAG: TatD family hydrolase, partial [Minisyncoccales bacterium]
MIPYIDIHAHLDFDVLYDNLDSYVKRAKEKNVLIVSNGVNPESNKKTLAIAKKFDNVKVALGIYPMDALGREENSQNDFDWEKEIKNIVSKKSKMIAFGEIGMDYYNGGRTEIDKDKQKKVFRKIIEVSKKISKPMIIHSRKAEKDIVDILEESNIDPNLVIMHCFSGKKSLINRCIENKWYFTIPTNVIRNHAFRSIIKRTDINHLFCETDSPFLSPYGRFET